MKIKEYFIAFGYSFIAGIIAGIVARIAVFPIVGFLHNRWIKVISLNTTELIYFWIGQIVGTLVFIIFLYTTLRKRDWSKMYSVLAVIISLLLLSIAGILLSSILNYA